MTEPFPTPPDATTPRLRSEAPARFTAILESTTDLVLMADKSGRTLYINKAGRDLLGWSVDELPERTPMSEMFPEWAFATVTEQGMPTAIATGSWSCETALKTRSGREIPVLQVLLAHLGEDGEVEFFSTICRDIGDRKQKELEQIEWSNRYDAAIRASGQVLFDWDSTNGVIDYGGAVERVTGFASHELDGGINQLRSLIHHEDREHFDSAISHVIDTREPLKTEFRFLRKDRREITVKAYGHFFLDRLGRIGRMVGFLSDITAERIFERGVQLAHERLEGAVAERTRELADANLLLQESARQQEAVARLGQRALLGIPLSELMDEAVALVRSSLQVDCASLNEWNPETQTLRAKSYTGWPDGPNYPDTPAGTLSQSGYTLIVGHPVISSNYQVEKRFSPSESCRVAGIQCALTAPIQANARPFAVLGAFSIKKRTFGQDDISFLQGVANILSAAIERLRVEETAQRAQVEAETANRAKSEFLSRMSHELRTPLNAILGFTQLLELDQHDERHMESITHISKAGHNLLEMINEVLDIARLDSGRVEFHREPVDLPSFLADVVILLKPLASKHGITIRIADSVGEPPVADTDRERLKQIFVNILSNAIKYNRPAGSVTIAVARKDSGFINVSVTDTGYGIPQESLSRLFVPFERLGQKEGGTAGGTGLGLALCQRLVKGLGGQIGVASTVGLGSTFWVELPGKAEISETVPSPVSNQTEPEPMADQSQKTVLYVEDDLSNYHLIERIIETRKGVKLVSAIDGSSVMDLIKLHPPSLILLDLNLPDTTGEILIEKLKGDDSSREIPVVLVTGEVASDRTNTVLRLGAAEILPKPYRIQDFLRVLDKYLGT
jgi:PAS domain S-box-containing protein